MAASAHTAGVVAPVVAMVVIEPPADYPEGYRACPICLVALGARCRARSGHVVGGRPDEVVFELDRPHIARPRRSRK